MERVELCACGHTIYDHLGHKYGEFADQVRAQIGEGDCERNKCVCAGFNSVGSIVDARRFRGAPDPVLNVGALHPLTRSLRKYIRDGSTVEWNVLSCDRCHVTDLDPDQIIPWMSYVLCPTCFGQGMQDLTANRIVEP